jgi:hypothetical protein
VSCSQGITARTVSHNNIENTAKIDVEAVSPIGGGIACVRVCMRSIQFTGPVPENASFTRKPPVIPIRI